MLKFEAARIHFLSEVFVAVAVAYYKRTIIMGSTSGFLLLLLAFSRYPMSRLLSICELVNLIHYGHIFPDSQETRLVVADNLCSNSFYMVNY